MNWFIERQQYNSQKNGSISAVRTFGAWEVSVDDCGQSTHYTNAMWKRSYTRIAKRFGNVHSVLMLGLGAGGSIPALHTTFPGCSVVAVEYDPEMVEVSKRLGLYQPYPFPEILLGDAATIVPALTRQFDLVIVDLFHGPHPSPLITDEGFLASLQKTLATNGVLIANVFRDAAYFDQAKTIFAYSDIYTYKRNTLGLFWNHQRQEA